MLYIFFLDFGLGGPNLSGPGGPGPGMLVPPSSSQPLPSNVLSKQQNNMDQQYLQQSSQIFVFSTQWANKAAESVMQGSYNSIISWHENQPDTKKHLDVSFNINLLNIYITSLSLQGIGVFADLIENSHFGFGEREEGTLIKLI